MKREANIIWSDYNKLKCVVLCAGKGARILPQSIGIPKIMIPIMERPILSYVIDYWKIFTDDFIFVIGYKRKEVVKFAKREPINSKFVIQSKPKGIAHALWCAKDLVSDRFIVILGDCLCNGKFNFPQGMEQGIGVWETDDSNAIRQSYSIKIKDNLICRVKEKPKRIFNNLCGMGFYFFDKRVFEYIAKAKPSELRNEIEITDVIQNMIDGGERIHPVFFQGDYLNITYSEDLKRAEIFL